MTVCARCGQSLTSPVWSESGDAYGLTCARRMGIVRDAERRDRTRAPLAVPRTCRDDERQVELFGSAEEFAPWEALGVAAALWPFVVAARAASADDPRCVEGCDGCDLWGLCAWHASSDENRKQWRRYAP